MTAPLSRVSATQLDNERLKNEGSAPLHARAHTEWALTLVHWCSQCKFPRSFAGRAGGFGRSTTTQLSHLRGTYRYPPGPLQSAHCAGCRDGLAAARPGGGTHRRAASGPLCSSSSCPSCPLASPTQTGGWSCSWSWLLASGSDPLVLCLFGWWNSVYEKAPYLWVSERCCSFLGTLRVLSPMTLIWLWKAQTARGTPQGWARRMGSSAASSVDAKPAHVQEKGF